MTPEEIREFASRGYWIKAELAVEALDSQAAEIKRLEGNQCYSGACSYAVNYEEDMTTYRIQRDKQRAALKNLGKMVRSRGKALVEERAGMVTAMRLARQLDAVWVIEEKTDEDRQIARRQLHAEGVIR